MWFTSTPSGGQVQPGNELPRGPTRFTCLPRGYLDFWEWGSRSLQRRLAWVLADHLALVSSCSILMAEMTAFSHKSTKLPRGALFTQGLFWMEDLLANIFTLPKFGILHTFLYPSFLNLICGLNKTTRIIVLLLSCASCSHTIHHANLYFSSLGLLWFLPSNFIYFLPQDFVLNTRSYSVLVLTYKIV